MASFSALTLRTARLELRPFGPGDADALFALHADPVVMRYGSSAPWSDRQQALDRLERDRREMAAGNYICLAIVPIGAATPIGDCSLFSLDAQCRRAEVGYSLRPASWGHGYANEAVAALLDWGFATLDLNRVEADIDPRNTPSARTLERLGFTREGHLRERWIVDGEVSDSWLYGLLARDWKAARAA
ncbi:MAG: GNAT family protein [Betaproteobacteria bacterium]